MISVFWITYRDDGADGLSREGEDEGVFLLQREKHVKQVLVFNNGRDISLLLALLDDATNDAVDSGVAPSQVAHGAAEPPDQP